MWNPTAFMGDNCDKEVSVIEENFPGKIFIRSCFKNIQFLLNLICQV